MIRSMYTGISGLKVNQGKMDVISNNLANTNTIGYKASRATFQNFLSQSLSAASEANEEESKGGKNPMQIGLGVNIASIDKIMTQGNAQITNNPFDVMLADDDSFLVVNDLNGLKLTRAGNLNFDAEGNLNVNGYKVYGWDSVYNEKTKEYEIEKKEIAPIVITKEKEYLEPESSTQIDFTGNFNATSLEDVRTSTVIYDSLGKAYTVPLLFKYDMKSKNWSYEIEPDSSGKRHIYQDGDKEKPIALNFTAEEASETSTGTTSPQNQNEKEKTLDILGHINFDTNGMIVRVEPEDKDKPKTNPTPSSSEDSKITYLKPPEDLPEDKTQFELFVSKPKETTLHPDSEFGKDGTGSIILDFTNLTQFGNKTADAQGMAKDGRKAGDLTDISIGKDGKIIGRYSNDMLIELSQITVANMKNPAGLESIGNNLFATTMNSGELNKNGDEGNFIVGSLEMSNVDLATETTEMIVTQRSYSANAMIITTADEMVREAIGMKR